MSNRNMPDYGEEMLRRAADGLPHPSDSSYSGRCKHGGRRCKKCDCEENPDGALDEIIEHQDRKKPLY